MPPVQYADSRGVSIAYQATGTGEVDLVFAPGTASHLDLDWEWPARARFYEDLGRFSRLIRFDKRGTGLSDRPTEAATLEERTDDIRAVMDAAESERAYVMGVSEGGSMACLFAATYPERTRGLLLWGTQARWTQAPDYPWGLDRRENEAMLDLLRAGWPSLEYVLGPGAGIGRDVDPALVEWWMRYLRSAASPSSIVAMEQLNAEIDVRGILPTIRVSTLVMNREGDPVAHVDAARAMAESIPGARFMPLPGNTHSMFMLEPEHVVGEIERFVTGRTAVVETNRVLATILFVDVAASTEHASALGDAAWSDRLSGLYARIEQELAVWSGQEVDRAGDGLLALFDGPTRAIRCASAIETAARPLGLELRAGLHTGEIERRDEVVRGIAVHMAARIAGAAAPGEVLVSSTVHDLVAGSGLRFGDRGLHTLKGIDGPRQLFALEDGQTGSTTPGGAQR
jgi:class 3 adenylate cyclase/pimeloyl-ACP methyl ester carboxylesterase